MPKLIVCGSMIMDFVARAPRIPATGETLIGDSFSEFPGGKGANQAVAAARVGAEVVMIGACGEDDVGARLTRFLSDNQVGTDWVTAVSSGKSGVALITVADSGENAITIVPGANAGLLSEWVSDVPVDAGDIALAQMEVPVPAIRTLFERARSVGARTVLNVAPAVDAARELLALTDIVIVNEVELAQMTGRQIDPLCREEVRAATGQLRTSESQAAIATLGAQGLYAQVQGKDWWMPAHQVSVVDTTGAGDCFSGVFAASLLAGLDFEAALARANLAASCCVTRPGAGPSMPSASELPEI